MDFKTPGVFIQEIPSFPPSVAEVATAIPAFIGYTERADLSKFGDFEAKDEGGDPAPLAGDDGLADVPFKISSMLEYEQHFGKAKYQENIEVEIDADDVPVKASFEGSFGPHNYRMHEALTMYFANGGGPCYVLSVGKHSTVKNADDSDLITFDPINKSDLAKDGGLAKIKRVDEVTLLLFPDAPGLGGVNFYDLYKDALKLCFDLKDRFTVIDVLREDPAIISPQTPIQFLRDNVSENLSYGAVYWPWLRTTLQHRFDLDEVKLLQPSKPAGDFNNKMLKDVAADKVTEVFRVLLTNTVNQIRVELPPSSSVAGIYAKVDSTRGVWKAPANVSVNAISGPTLKISDKEQEDLNVHDTGKSINAIRTFAGRGTLVWGARTLDGNSNDFRYVSVRRFLNMVEESTKKATQRFVFEPNDANTWVMVRGMIENFLLLQWRAGALQGAKPEQAFFVRVGLPDTMTALDILEGRMNVDIGMAIVRPAEFIILKFSHKLPEA